MNDNANRIVALPTADLEQTYEWDPGFEGDRWVVVSRIGPFVKVFKKPQNYRKRIFHRVYNLAVQDWAIVSEAKFLAGLCTITAKLDVRFQPTIRYVQDKLDILPDVSGHIKSTYESLLKDAIERELGEAEEDRWVREGLGKMERSIEIVVNESLAAQNIQCRCRCQLEPAFEDLSDEKIESMSGHFEKQSAYLELVRRNHEFESKRDQEEFRHAEQKERAELEHQRNLLDQFRRDEAVRKTMAREETERINTQLQEDEKRQAAQQASEERRHTERIEHESNLRKMELEAKQQEREMRLRATEHSDDILRREIELLVLERQRNSLEEEVEDIVREWDHKKIQVQSLEQEPEQEDADFASIPSPEDAERRD